MAASQWTTATVSGLPSPSRSPVAFLTTTAFACPHSRGKATPVVVGGAAATGADFASVPAAGWAAVAEPGWRSEERATTPATAVAGATQWIGRGGVGTRPRRQAGGWRPSGSGGYGCERVPGRRIAALGVSPAGLCRWGGQHG